MTAGRGSVGCTTSGSFRWAMTGAPLRLRSIDKNGFSIVMASMAPNPAPLQRANAAWWGVAPAGAVTGRIHQPVTIDLADRRQGRQFPVQLT